VGHHAVLYRWAYDNNGVFSFIAYTVASKANAGISEGVGAKLGNISTIFHLNSPVPLGDWVRVRGWSLFQKQK
jgi:hypothetical protein